jgi:hypothetical protein
MCSLCVGAGPCTNVHVNSYVRRASYPRILSGGLESFNSLSGNDLWARIGRKQNITRVAMIELASEFSE